MISSEPEVSLFTGEADVAASDMLIAFEIVGVPTVPPVVGETYQIALIFERTTIADYQGLVDGVWVNWEITNGPKAKVTAEDTFSYAGSTGKDLAEKDLIGNNWHVADWTYAQPFTCQKLESEGCDILTAKIYKYWHEFNTIEDVSLANGIYLISLFTKKCSGVSNCETEQYNKESVRMIDISLTAGGQFLAAGGALGALLMLNF